MVRRWDGGNVKRQNDGTVGWRGGGTMGWWNEVVCWYDGIVISVFFF